MPKTQIYISLFIVSFVFLVLNNLSLFIGIMTSSPEFIFLGRHNINFQDLYTYVSFIEQAKQGHIFFQNLYMSEPQTASLIRPSYLVIGEVARFLHVPSIVAYHAARIILCLVFFIVLWQFLKLFFKRDSTRLISYTIVLFSSGIGFLAQIVSSNSTDSWIPESITYLALNEAPHFILSLILMMAGFMLFLKGLERSSRARFLASGLFFFLLTFEHPFNLFVVGVMLVVSAAWYKWKKEFDVKILLQSLFLTLPFIALGLFYQYYETQTNPILQKWAVQNLLLSPHPINYIYGYGIILLFAVFGLEKFLREQKKEQVLILSWIFATVSLLYAPVFFQRRFIEGLHIPLSILATYGILTVSLILSRFVQTRIQKLFIRFFIILSILLLSVSSVLTSLGDVKEIALDSTEGYYYHVLGQEMEGMMWLKNNTGTKDVILTNYFYGNVMPGVIGRKVYVGHKVQTPYMSEKVNKINTFLLNKNSKSAYKFLKDNGITYIYLGKNDSMITYGFKPEAKSYLTRVFDSGGVSVYKVR